MPKTTLTRGLLAVFAAAGALAADVTLAISTPMVPPHWALLERELLRANSDAVELFAKRYLDERGYLLHTPRWGTLDGPDDALETFYNWTLLHALGGSDSVLEIYKKGYEGHLRQYGELRTTLTDLAKHGAYYHEFITMSDWFHTGEGMRAVLLQGLSDPTSQLLQTRMRRFAGLYMNENPEAPNYDPVHKVIKSIWNGSKGPMMRKATTYDWVGDPVPGRFHLIHHPDRTQMYNLMERYPKMLAHCEEYLDSVGDNFLNLAATSLHLNAYALTQEDKYRNWVIEYVDAWKARAAATGGNIPSNVGLDGTPGGEYKGQWWKGTYGWNFSIFDGEIDQIAHRNYFTAGSWPGFGNAYLLTGDPSYIAVLRRQMDNIYAQQKAENGRTMLPSMYGDPRGYKYSGAPQWYRWTTNLHIPQLTEIYLWSMDRRDLGRIPKTGWIGFLEGVNPTYPEEALSGDLRRLRQQLDAIRTDPTSPDSRLADYVLNLSPAQTNALTNLMIGGFFTGRIWTLHSRVRYFDPEKRRSGIPEDVAALVEKMTADAVTLTLVNVNQVKPRTVIVQAGGYAEHKFQSVADGGKVVPIENSHITVRIEPGSGARLEFKMTRYANRPNLAQPWDRGSMIATK